MAGEICTRSDCDWSCPNCCYDQDQTEDGEWRDWVSHESEE